MKQTWPAPERNKGPIAEVLRTVLPPAGRVLEVASGSGQHIAHFAATFPGLEFLPSDPSDENLASISAYVDELGLPNLNPPRRLDVRDEAWGTGDADAILCSNMIHIAPWESAIALLDGASRHLVPGGHLVLYGPFRVGGLHTAESNAAFDRDLRDRNPAWGIRDLDEVVAEAARRGLAFVRRVDMPANNQVLILVRDA